MGVTLKFVSVSISPFLSGVYFSVRPFVASASPTAPTKPQLHLLQPRVFVCCPSFYKRRPIWVFWLRAGGCGWCWPVMVFLDTYADLRRTPPAFRKATVSNSKLNPLSIYIPSRTLDTTLLENCSGSSGSTPPCPHLQLGVCSGLSYNSYQTPPNVHAWTFLGLRPSSPAKFNFYQGRWQWAIFALYYLVCKSCQAHPNWLR